MNSNQSSITPPFEGGQGGLNLFIIGPSGCGKSTQAKLIAQNYHLIHFSMGQLLRDEIAAGTQLGAKAKNFIDRGIWVSDDLVIDILTASLTQIDNQNFIVDGFPRVLNQGKIIEYYLETAQNPFSLLIHLDVAFDEVLARRRRMGESFQDKDRTDNTPKAVVKRQRSYDETINPIMDYFQKANKLFRVDGNRPIEPIFSDICRAVDKVYGNHI